MKRTRNTSKISFLVRLEETSMLILSFYLSYLLGFEWWVFVLFLFAPDSSMLAYFFGNKTGASVYNFFHYKFFAVSIGLVGYLININQLAFAGTILFGHSSLDRILGYGLKYPQGFEFTHLGKIRNKNKKI